MIVTEFGRFHTLRSDNGPCYASKEFREFMELHGIFHSTSSPHHHQSNGFAEAMVKIAKKQMEKSTQDRKPWNHGLLEYRCTPISGTLPSPLEMLMNRKPRTVLPQMPSSFQTVPRDSTHLRDELVKRQSQQSRGKDNPRNPVHLDFEPGQPVWVMEPNGKSWKPASIARPAMEPSSFWVTFADNSTLRRTQAYIKPRAVPSVGELCKEGLVPTPSMELTPAPISTDTGNERKIPIPSTPAVPDALKASPAPPRRSTRSNFGKAPDRFQPS